MPEKTALQIFLNFADIVASEYEMSKYSEAKKVNFTFLNSPSSHWESTSSCESPISLWVLRDEHLHLDMDRREESASVKKLVHKYAYITISFPF